MTVCLTQCSLLSMKQLLTEFNGVYMYINSKLECDNDRVLKVI